MYSLPVNHKMYVFMSVIWQILLSLLIAGPLITQIAPVCVFAQEQSTNLLSRLDARVTAQEL